MWCIIFTIAVVSTTSNGKMQDSNWGGEDEVFILKNMKNQLNKMRMWQQKISLNNHETNDACNLCLTHQFPHVSSCFLVGSVDLSRRIFNVDIFTFFASIQTENCRKQELNRLLLSEGKGRISGEYAIRPCISGKYTPFSYKIVVLISPAICHMNMSNDLFIRRWCHMHSILSCFSLGKNNASSFVDISKTEWIGWTPAGATPAGEEKSVTWIEYIIRHVELLYDCTVYS